MGNLSQYLVLLTSLIISTDGHFLNNIPVLLRDWGATITKFQTSIAHIQNTISNFEKEVIRMKKNIIFVLSVIGAILLIGSFPLKLIADGMVVDICRLVGFVLIFVVLGLRIFQKDKSAKADDKGA